MLVGVEEERVISGPCSKRTGPTSRFLIMPEKVSNVSDGAAVLIGEDAATAVKVSVTLEYSGLKEGVLVATSRAF